MLQSKPIFCWRLQPLSVLGSFGVVSYFLHSTVSLAEFNVSNFRSFLKKSSEQTGSYTSPPIYTNGLI